jgi:hypothetical protein
MDPVQRVRYVADELRKNGSDPGWWRRRINARVNSPVQRSIRPRSAGIDIPDADWDVLVVVDATRKDLFRDRSVELVLPFDRHVVRSQGSSTREWLSQNFTGAYGDIVYVTGNPQVSKYAPDQFHRLVEVWRDSFSQEIGTVPATAVTEAAITASESHPSKRLIVHYIQPHEPFVNHPELNFFDFGEHIPFNSENGQDTDDERVPHFHGTVFEAVHRGIVSEAHVWEGYLDNLNYVLESVNKLLEHMNGRIVVTSDHGNCFPRLSWPVPVPVWGHTPKMRHRELIDVPWLEADVSNRPMIVDEGVNPARSADDEIDKKLSYLGYT